MRIALCTISFRHHLVSIGELARFARGHGFDGIELWGSSSLASPCVRHCRSRANCAAGGVAALDPAAVELLMRCRALMRGTFLRCTKIRLMMPRCAVQRLSNGRTRAQSAIAAANTSGR